VFPDISISDKNKIIPNYINIYPNQIQNKLLSSESSENYSSRIYFSTDGTVSFDIEASRILSMTQSDIKMQSNLKVLQDFVLGSVTDSGVRMSYRKVNNGYDLYIEEV
jgi:hypothetical protein